MPSFMKNKRKNVNSLKEVEGPLKESLKIQRRNACIAPVAHHVFTHHFLPAKILIPVMSCIRTSKMMVKAFTPHLLLFISPRCLKPEYYSGYPQGKYRYDIPRYLNIDYFPLYEVAPL